MKKFIFLCVFLFSCVMANAQEQLLNIAKQYLLAGNFEKAATTYKQLLDYNENDPHIINSYLEALMGLKDYTTAEKFIKTQQKKNNNNALFPFYLIRIYKELKDDKKASKIFDKIINNLSPLQNEIKTTATLYDKSGMPYEAIKIYEKGRLLHKENSYIFAEELAVLYDKTGNGEKATESLLNVYVSQNEKAEDVKSALLRILNKPEKVEKFKQLIGKKTAEQPDIFVYQDLLAWLSIQQKDYETAFIQIKNIDKKLNEQGRRVLGFARTCLRENEFKSALLAYDAVANEGTDMPFYKTARGEKLICLKKQLEKNPHYTTEDIVNIETEYDKLLNDLPIFKTHEIIREYASIEARYSHNIEKAISLLDEALKPNNPDVMLKAKCKIDKGDYELIRNEIWESTLLYSQVDKDFKNDVLGEEARFKNAKLSYYTGDFDWAQGQLDVLKASTSELIANDALNLSVLITENNPIADSNKTPLQLFAYADLLSFQNKDEEALALLDSISTEYPKHPLADNILMQKANMAYKKQDYSEAAMHLQKIVANYSDDVLADDALFNLALINENFFSNKDEAKRLYEQIIIKYPGSSFVNQARKNFRRLRGDKEDVDLQ